MSPIENPMLDDPLPAVARELRQAAPPAGLLASIHRQLDSRGAAAARRSSWKLQWTGWAGLSATCAALALLWIVGAPPQADTALQQEASNGFVPLAGTAGWQQAVQADDGRVWLVATDMPHSRLATLGLPYDPARAGERVGAQLLMQGSGDVLAVRITP